MPNENTKTDRAAPKYFIDKKQGLRHLLHAAIRMTLAGEDPFAINMLAQSAEKVMLDLLKHAAIDDPILFEDRIVPERRKEFFRIYRQTFNFLKHAKDDATTKLPVYDIVMGNELLLFINIVRYRRLFTEITVHMQMFFACAVLLHPNLIKWQQMGGLGEQFLKERESFEHWTRSECLKTAATSCSENPIYFRERIEDLHFVNEANHQRLSGESGPLRLQIPSQ